MKWTLTLILVASSLTPLSCWSAGATGSLDLPIDEFNARGKSWRALEDQGDFRGAAEMLEAYETKHAAALSEDEIVLLHFHAAQEFAFSGEISRALTHLSKAKYKVDRRDWPRAWNDYVDATEAFLRGDRPALVSARERILAGPKFEGLPLNLHAIDAMIEHFDGSYLEAMRQASRSNLLKRNDAEPARGD